MIIYRIAQNANWTKEEVLKDELSPRGRNIIEYLVQFHNNDWVEMKELTDAELFFPMTLNALAEKGLISIHKAKGMFRPWAYWDIKLTDKGRYI